MIVFLSQIAELEKEISQFDTRLKKATMDIKAMGEQEQELTAQLKELNVSFCKPNSPHPTLPQPPTQPPMRRRPRPRIL